jgi:hypothetical protein
VNEWMKMNEWMNEQTKPYCSPNNI